MKNLKFEILNLKLKEKGFTLVELILYVALVTMMLLTVIPFAWNVIGGGVKLTTEQEVYSQARYLSERIKKEVREASAVVTCINSGTLRIELDKPDISENTGICYNASTDVITVVQGNPPLTCPGTDSIHSDDTRVTAFTCTNYTGTGTDNIRVNFTMTDDYNTTRSEYAESILMQFTAETRN